MQDLDCFLYPFSFTDMVWFNHHFLNLLVLKTRVLNQTILDTPTMLNELTPCRISLHIVLTVSCKHHLYWSLNKDQSICLFWICIDDFYINTIRWYQSIWCKYNQKGNTYCNFFLIPSLSMKKRINTKDATISLELTHKLKCTDKYLPMIQTYQYPKE